MKTFAKKASLYYEYNRRYPLLVDLLKTLQNLDCVRCLNIYVSVSLSEFRTLIFRAQLT